MKILVVDDDAMVRELITLMLEYSFSVTTREAGSGNQAIEILRSEQDISCIICDFNMKNGTGEDVYRHLLAANSSIPFILCSSDHPDKHTIFAANPPFGFACKPDIFYPLERIVARILPRRPEQTAPKYFPIRASTVLRFGLLTADLYIKLSEDKFVKIMREGDLFGDEDFDRFDSKKINFLYVSRADAKNVVDKMIRDVLRLSEAKRATQEMGLYVSTASLDLISEFSHSLGFTPEIQQLTNASIKLALNTIRQNPRLSDLYTCATVDPESFLASHSVILSHLACGISSLLGWSSDITFYKIALAAFLHDITLRGPELSKIQTPQELSAPGTTFTAEEVKQFMRHPEDAAHAVDEFSEVPADVSTIISQHQERPDGSGFPAGLDYLKISPLASVFIIAEDLLFFRTSRGPDADVSLFLNTLTHSTYRGKFRDILTAVTHALIMQSND